MANPTTVITRSYEVDENRDVETIKNAEALTVGGMAAINMSTGLLEFMDDADDLLPAGVIVGSNDGNNDHLTGVTASAWKAIVRSGIILKNVTVTGASAITDKNKPVFMTDGQTFTLTVPATGLPVGLVQKWVSSTTCDVWITPSNILAILGIIGGALTGYDNLPLGTFGTNALAGTSAITLRTFPASLKHFKIISLHAIPTTIDAGAVAGSQALNLAIGGVATTGGVLTLAYTSCDAQADMATIIDATAITAANEVHIGDVLTLLMAASGTGFTDAQLSAFEIWAKIQYLPGA